MALHPFTLSQVILIVSRERFGIFIQFVTEFIEKEKYRSMDRNEKRF